MVLQAGLATPEALGQVEANADSKEATRLVVLRGVWLVGAPGSGRREEATVQGDCGELLVKDYWCGRPWANFRNGPPRRRPFRPTSNVVAVHNRCQAAEEIPSKKNKPSARLLTALWLKCACDRRTDRREESRSPHTPSYAASANTQNRALHAVWRGRE